jgi:unsaturated rhamnogalacturonyl hydrolase
MRRRNFIINIPFIGLTAGISGTFVNGCAQTNDQGNLFNRKNLDDKVKMAMLTMQRRTWEQGVAMQAMLESGESELVILMARDAVMYQSTDGRLAMIGEEFALADAASPGEAVLWAARKTGDPILQEGFNKLLNYILNKAPRTEDGILYHFTNIPQIWSDILYMLPPFLAAAGEYKEAIRQIDGVRLCLWDEEKRLFSHMWDCEKQIFPRKDFWGVGNGWSAAGLTRVIRSLPETMTSEKQKLTGYLQDLIDGCLTYLRDDGLFHNVVDNPESFIETNLSQMLAYSIYRGIKGGWIDGSYKEKADKMRAAAHLKVDELGLVQGVCGAPEFDHPGVAAEGQVFFILMETAHKDLLC